jgi:hypothetical protein
MTLKGRFETKIRIFFIRLNAKSGYFLLCVSSIIGTGSHLIPMAENGFRPRAAENIRPILDTT